MKRICLVLVCLSLPYAFTGCGSTQPAADSKAKGGAPAEHAGHGAGPHEGVVTDWGGGKYHVEFTVDHGKKEATVYILGGDEKTPAPVKATNVMLTINDPKFETELKAQPQPGDPEGASSRYVGTHDNLGIVREFAGTISGEIEGTPFSGDFKEEPHAADHKH
jgi:hypothetical protein